MQSSKTMRERAKAVALGRPLEVPKNGAGYVGYAIPMKHLREMYLRQGFPINRRENNLLETHLEMWQLSHTAILSGDLVFFALDDDLKDLEARQNVYRYIHAEGGGSSKLVDISELMISEAGL